MMTRSFLFPKKYSPNQKPDMIRVPDAPSILITRLSHIGDCVLTIPVAAALKRRFPDCTIAWAVEKPSGQLVELSPHVDHVIDVPKSWIKSGKHWRDLRRTFRQHRFDLAIDPQSISKSSVLARLSGAKTRIGLRGKWARELAPFLNNHQVSVRASHLVDRSLGMLSPLGIESSPCSDAVRFPMRVCELSHESVSRWMTAQGLHDSGFAVINPGASWPSKRWETDRFGHVAAHLMNTHSMRSVVVWAGEAEQQMAERIAGIANETSDGAVTVAARTNLRELLELCRQAQFFFGCDTGPLHIAAAAGTPCVGMYGPTRAEDSGAYGSAHIVLQVRYQSGTSRQRRSAANDAMREISVELACDGCDRMIAGGSSGFKIEAA